MGNAGISLGKWFPIMTSTQQWHEVEAASSMGSEEPRGRWCRGEGGYDVLCLPASLGGQQSTPGSHSTSRNGGLGSQDTDHLQNLCFLCRALS